MVIGVPKESFPGERRVALIPASLPAIIKAGLEIMIESGSGDEAGYPDALYVEKGARVVKSHKELFNSSDIILQVRAAGANPKEGAADLKIMRKGQTLIGLLNPYSSPESIKTLMSRGVTSFALELLPRITKAQSMDVLSSMASVAGYKAVLLAAGELTKMFPMMITAAGTIVPARVFVIGAGVAGLQAIATAHRLGAVVKAYDIRPVVKDQVQSLGAKFIELDLDQGETETDGGYAKAMDEEFYRKQREMMTHELTESDVLITTAAVPGKKAPVLVTENMVKEMPRDSVIVDLAAEQGGNCEISKPGEKTVHHGVTIISPLNLPSTVPYHTSQLYSKNISTFLLSMVKEGVFDPDPEDEIVKATMITKDGNMLKELTG
jgi:NAD(P) transhydrogenase subunit alpha